MAENSSFVQPSIPKFDGHYDHWAMLMENFLRSKEYWSLVENGIPTAVGGTESTEAQRKTVEDQKLKDLKVKNYLFQAIDRSILETILKKETSKNIWDSMKQKYQGTARVKRAQLQALRREFEILQMKAGESVNEYFSRTLTIANKMRTHGETMGDVVVIEKILRSMTPKFNYVVCSIEESNDIDALSVDQLQSSLLVHEQRMNVPVIEEQALKVTYESRTRGRGRGRGGFRGRGGGRGMPNFDKSTVECYYCHKLGHFQYECPSKESEVNYAEFQDEMLLMASMENKESDKEEAWFIDSGCSNHMCGKKEVFSDLDENFSETVKLGNNSSMAVKGKGNVRFQLNGISHIITSVFYVPELKNNLLSIGQLQEKGLTIIFQHGKCKIYHKEKGLIMETTMSSNRMFILPVKPQSNVSACFNTITEDSTQLWHCRFGHLGFKGLRILEQKRMVNGLPQLKTPSKICKDCLAGKQQRDPFPKVSTWRASQILQLIHADICGPITPASNSKKRYLITFIDDYSRKTWVYFLVEKSEAFDTFRSFKNHVEKETSIFIKCLRTDRGGEFTSQAFNDFCKENGINRQLTAAYTPQQNGVAERKNKTIMNMVRCMLYEKQVPRNFWPEAVNWTVHVLNRCPTVAVKNKTPEEAWSDVKPSVEYFRVFGCVSHVHVPDRKRTKLDRKSTSCVLLGVSEESKAYRLYDPISHKIIVSRDVVFEEDKSWDWNKRHEENIKENLDWEDEQDESASAASAENDTSINEEIQGELDHSDSNDSIEESRQDSNRRIIRRPAWMRDYESGEGLSEEEENMTNMAMFAGADPISFEEAVKSEKWRNAMNLELESIEKNDTWELTNLPVGGKKIGVKWIFKTKLNENGEIDKHKARLVAKGYAQKYGVDYNEVFAPVARLDTIRLVLALAAQRGWTVYQLDVKSAFLHGVLNEEVFVEQPCGYEIKDNEHKVYKLKKALYGLKQAPRAWYSRIESYFLKEGFEKCTHEHTLFVKTSAGGKILIVSLYVDDLIFTGNDESMYVEFKKSMMVEFDMTDLGKMRYFLGVEVMQKSDGIFISQKKYVMEVLERFGMDKSNSVLNPMVPGEKLQKDQDGMKIDSTYYKQIVGSLMYLTATRPDVMFAVSLISRYMEHPTKLHLQAATKILRYLRGTADYGVFYKKGGNEELVAYTDSDYAGDLDDRKSTSGYVFLLSSAAISWLSKKQPVVSLSTTEAEFIAASTCACQAVWLRKILEKLGHTQNSSTTVYCDSNSAIKLAKNPVMHGRSKHIDVRFHFLRELVKDETIELVHCNTQEQVADVMTKPLKLDAFVKLRNLLGVCQLPIVN